jgi:hypothetical protein
MPWLFMLWCRVVCARLLRVSSYFYTFVAIFRYFWLFYMVRVDGAISETQKAVVLEVQFSHDPNMGSGKKNVWS